MPEPEQNPRQAHARSAALAKEVVAELDAADRTVLYAWATELLEIREAPVGRVRKAAAAIRATATKDRAVALARRMHEPLKKAGSKGKQLLWDERGWAGRLALGGVTAGLAVGGPEAGAGIAALGGAIGVPLRLLTGAGGAFLGTLVEELRPLLPAGSTTPSSATDWSEADELGQIERQLDGELERIERELDQLLVGETEAEG